MVTRRTTMRARTGTARRMPVTELGRTAATEAETRLNEVERRVHVAARSVAKLARHSMEETMTAAQVVRGSMREALRAVMRAGRSIAREAMATRQAVLPTPALMKRPARRTTARAAA